VEEPEVLYRKVGRRYEPFKQHFGTDHLPEGAYLVIIRPGRRSMTTRVCPHNLDIRIELALRLAEDTISRSLVENKITPTMPKNLELTKDQMKAFRMWRKAFDTDRVYLPSARDVSEAVVKDLADFIKETGGDGT